MGCFSGPEIVNRGLVFHYDMANTQKSWRGRPVTNLLYDSGVINWSIGNLIASVTRTTVVQNSVYRITSTTGGAFRLFVPPSKLTNGASYNLSYKYKILSGGTSFNMTDWCDTQLFNVVNTQFDDHVFSSAYGTRSTYDAVYRFMDFTISANTVVEIWDVQLEQNTFSSPFVDGIRSNTQAILDLTKNNIVTANSLTYQSDGTFSFNGSNTYASVPLPVLSNEPYTIIQWLRPSTPLLSGGSGASKPTGTNRKTPLVGPGPVWNPGIWMTSDYLRVHANTQYRDAAISWTTTDWNMIGMTYDGTNCQIIFNDKFLPIAFTTSYAPAALSTLYLGAETSTGSSVNWNGDIGITQFYNRTLSAAEIKQNFEATRSRYGI